MSSAAPSPSLRNLFSELEQLFHTETEARVSTSVQAAERSLSENLNQAVRRLRQTEDFAQIAAVLCDVSARFAKTCAVFHIHEDSIGGEYRRGPAGEADEHFRDIRFGAAEAAAFRSAMDSGEPVVALCSASEVSPALVEFLHGAAGEKAHLFPLTVDRTTVGVLYAAGDVETAALELLAQTTALVLEARQRPARREPAAAGLVTIEPATSASKPSRDWDDLTPADRQLHLRAQRFARSKVAEIRLYRPDAVKAGRAQGDLYEVLREPIDEGREIFRQTFMTASPTMVDYFHAELVRTLANDHAEWLGGKYPGRLA